MFKYPKPFLWDKMKFDSSWKPALGLLLIISAIIKGLTEAHGLNPIWSNGAATWVIMGLGIFLCVRKGNLSHFLRKLYNR